MKNLISTAIGSLSLVVVLSLNLGCMSSISLVKDTQNPIKVKVTDSLDSDDIDMLQDMIKSAYNEAAKKVDDTTEKKMGKFGNIPGLF